MIELRGVSKRFVDNIVLDKVDFTVQDGETMALLGPSGVGKSVLLKHIIGLIKPDAGEVIVDARNVAKLSPHHPAPLPRTIAYWFQNPPPFHPMSPAHNHHLRT